MDWALLYMEDGNEVLIALLFHSAEILGVDPKSLFFPAGRRFPETQ
jgi:hypothetical protein